MNSLAVLHMTCTVRIRAIYKDCDAIWKFSHSDEIFPFEADWMPSRLTSIHPIKTCASQQLSWQSGVNTQEQQRLKGLVLTLRLQRTLLQEENIPTTYPPPSSSRSNKSTWSVSASSPTGIEGENNLLHILKTAAAGGSKTTPPQVQGQIIHVLSTDFDHNLIFDVNTLLHVVILACWVKRWPKSTCFVIQAGLLASQPAARKNTTQIS